jgi:hypothetical protein
MWRCWPISEDFDDSAGAVQIHLPVTQRVNSQMDHAIDTLERRLQSFARSKINTGTPAR